MSYIGVISILCFGCVILVDGSHFLGGTITWKPLNTSATGSLVAIVISQTYLWTYSLVQCTASMVTSNQLVIAPFYPLLSYSTLNCIANCGNGSIGYTSILIIPYCVDASAVTGVTVGQRLDTVYLEVDDNFSAAYQDNAWRILATASNAQWSISTNINVVPRSDNDLYNSAPVATIMSPINIYANQSKVISIPIGDADGDPMVCRWSTAANGVDECGQVCPPGSLPPSTVIYPNCTIIITGQNLGDWFAVTVMVEDFINSSSTSALSSVPVQFLVHVVAPPTCSSLPEIIGDPIEDSCTVVLVGQTFSSQLIAINNCGSTVKITDIATLSFAGMDKSNLTMFNSSTYYKTLTWTPTAAQVGYQVMCAMAINSQNAQSSQYCFKFYVSNENLCSCPGSGETCSTITTSTTYTTTSHTSTNWTLIGSLLGSALFFASILAACVCWYCFCSCGIRTFRLAHCQGPFEYYYIESIDEERWERSASFDERTPSPVIQSARRKNYRVYHILNESPNSFISRSPSSNDDDSRQNFWSNDEYTTRPVTNERTRKQPSKTIFRRIRLIRVKRRRVTVHPVAPGTSSPSTPLEMNVSSIRHQLPYYKQKSTE